MIDVGHLSYRACHENPQNLANFAKNMRYLFLNLQNYTNSRLVILLLFKKQIARPKQENVCGSRTGLKFLFSFFSVNAAILLVVIVIAIRFVYLWQQFKLSKRKLCRIVKIND